MIFNKMTVLTDHEGRTQIGNSLQACVASVMNLPMDKVPHFYEPQVGETNDAAIATLAHKRLAKWLDQFGLYPVELHLHEPVADEWFKIIEGYHIRGGARPPLGETHWCVAYQTDLIHDPHPENNFINPFKFPDTNVWRIIIFGKKL